MMINYHYDYLTAEFDDYLLPLENELNELDDIEGDLEFLKKQSILND